MIGVVSWAFREFLEFIGQKGRSPNLTKEEQHYLRTLIWNMSPLEVALVNEVLAEALIKKLGMDKPPHF